MSRVIFIQTSGLLIAFSILNPDMTGERTVARAQWRPVPQLINLWYFLIHCLGVSQGTL